MSQAQFLNTRRAAGYLAFSAHQTGAAFTARTPVAKASLPATLIKPYDKNKISGDVTNLMKVTMMGVGSAGNQPKCIVIGWQRLAESINLWMPQVLVELTGTLGAATCSVLGSTVRICDVLTATAGVGVEGGSGLAQLKQYDAVVDAAAAIVDLYDFELFEIQAIKGTATSANVAFSRL